MTTVTVTNTLKDELNKADPNTLADALRELGLGSLLTQGAFLVDKVVTNNPISVDIPLVPPATVVLTCEVTGAGGGGGALGTRVMGNSDCTPSAPHAAGVPAIAKLAANGSKITVEGTVATAHVTYLAMPDLTGAFPGA